jgi:hypothetical protein
MIPSPGCRNKLPVRSEGKPRRYGRSGIWGLTHGPRPGRAEPLSPSETSASTVRRSARRRPQDTRLSRRATRRPSPATGAIAAWPSSVSLDAPTGDGPEDRTKVENAGANSRRDRVLQVLRRGKLRNSPNAPVLRGGLLSADYVAPFASITRVRQSLGNMEVRREPGKPCTRESRIRGERFEESCIVSHLGAVRLARG